MKRRIAVIEDDKSINNGITLAIGYEDYDYEQFYCISDIGDIRCLDDMDLVILDINLPDGSGLDLLSRLRKTSRVPVLVLTANDTEMDEVMGLKLGADDYITKPFSLMVLRLRVEKLLDRNNTHKVYENASLYLDFENMVFKKNTSNIELSKTEIRLLQYLVINEGITLTRQRLMEHVWDNQTYIDENALSVVVKRLRDKLEMADEKYIFTSYGVGYVWKWM